MKARFLIVTMLAVATMALLTAPPACAVDVSGDQSGTWALANSPYVVTAKVVVPAGKALTIEPGVTVRFNQGVLLDVYGTLNARGTAAAPITFTSNGSLVPGWWRCIWFENGSSGTLENCKVLYTGASENTAIYLEGSVSPTISNCEVSFVAGDGIKVYGKAAPTLTGNIISNCSGWPVRLFEWSAMPAFQNNTFSANRYHGVRFEGHTIPDSQQVAWRHPGAPYSIGRVNIGTRATLTLPAGLVVKLDKGQIVDVYGNLVAKGTASQPVVFTALTDDTGGDTNGDRDTTRAAAGWWRCIWFDPSGSGTLDHCKVLYAGASDNAALYLDGDVPPTISNCEISFVAGDGIKVYKGTPTLTGNTISNCSGWPVHLFAWSAMPVFEGNTYSSNRYHGVRFDNASVPDGQQVAWRHPGAPYSVGGRLNIGNKATLTLPAGLVVKFGQRELLDVYGSLVARGTASQPVVFTALTDDTGGDTNGDRDTTRAAAGWWRNIWFEPSGSGTLDHCKVLYAGASDNAAILCAGGTSPTVSNSEVSSSSGNGVLVLDTAKPVLSPNNVIERCGGAGVRNDGSATVNAEDNWWGDASGPLHPTLNAGGKGLKVSDRVDFSPYLTQRSGGGWGIIAADSTTWAGSVAGFSSQYGTSDWAATQALGPPNTPSDHADYKTAWASAGADDRRESLEVGYATPTAIVGVDIYETFNPGAVDTVQARDPDGGLHLLWSGQAKEQPKQARVFSLRFPATAYPVKGIRISLNSPAVPGWNEIDAVGVLSAKAAQPPGGAVLKTSKQGYAPNERVVVEFSGFPGNPQDWITVVRASADTSAYGQWFYTEGKTSGSFTFNGFPAGRYEARAYFNWPAGGFKVQARYAFTVEGTPYAGPDSTLWAASVAGFSTQYGTDSWAAAQALGAPNTYPDHGDYPTAWASETKDDRREHLEVVYATPVFITGVDIYETFNPGAVDTVQARAPDGRLYLLWSGQARALPSRARIFSVRVPATAYPVKSIRVSLNSPAVPGWNEIDAVGILPAGAQPPGAGPAISLSDTTLEFASVAVGTTSQKTLTVANKGSVNLTITGVGVTGTEEFRVSPTTVAVAAGQSLTLTVTFAPTSAGNKSGALHITHNAAGSPTSVKLYGTGSAPAGPLTPKAGDGTAGLGAGDARTSALGNVKPGQRVEVPIVFNQEVAASTGFQVKLTFDPKKLKVVGGKGDGAFASALFPGPPQVTGNTVAYGGAFLGSSVTARGALGTLTFEALADFSGEVEIVLSEVSIKISGGSKDFKPGASVVISSGPVAGGPPSPDFDGDGEVGFSDFFEFAGAFGQKATGANARFDLDGDGEVGFGDFFAFAAEFGKKL